MSDVNMGNSAKELRCTCLAAGGELERGRLRCHTCASVERRICWIISCARAESCTSLSVEHATVFLACEGGARGRCMRKIRRGGEW